MDDYIPKEYKIQAAIRQSLENNFNICPYEIIYVDQQQNSLALLRISVWVNEELEEIKNILGYNSLCDKTGFLEFKETNTAIIRGFALLNFMRALGLAN